MPWSRVASSKGRETIAIDGGLRIDLAERSATLDDEPLDLSPLLWRLLLALAERPHQLVTRAELKRSLWPYAERIDTERRLNTAVRALRATLGDDAEAPRYIATVRSGGYRWIARDRRGWRKPAGAGLAVACVMAMVASLAPIETAATRDELTAVMLAQSAVEEWRGAPAAAALARAERRVDDAAARAGMTPALLVLKAELELGGHWRWQSAERGYRRALAIEPGHADARLGLAWLHVNRGDRAEAQRLAKELLADTVLAGERRADVGWLLIRAGRPDLASAACAVNAAASINRLSCAHTALAALGKTEEARSIAVELMKKQGADRRSVERVRALPAAAGYGEFLDWRVARFLPEHAPSFQRAQVLADAGRKDEALASLAHSVAKREPLAVKIGSTPSFEILRRDPRFQMLAQAVGAPLRAGV